MNTFKLPDLRFEQTFLRQLDIYAGRGPHASSSAPPQSIAALTDDELKLLNKDIDAQEQKELQPLQPITPGVVIYAVLKDQVLMPLLQGFLWTGFLISVGPLLAGVAAHGQRWGTWLANAIGINTIRRPRYQ